MVVSFSLLCSVCSVENRKWSLTGRRKKKLTIYSSLFFRGCIWYSLCIDLPLPSEKSEGDVCTQAIMTPLSSSKWLEQPMRLWNSSLKFYIIQFEPSYLRDTPKFHNLTVYSYHFELDNGVVTTSKRHSFLAFLVFLAHVWYSLTHSSLRSISLRGIFWTTRGWWQSSLSQRCIQRPTMYALYVSYVRPGYWFTLCLSFWRWHHEELVLASSWWPRRQVARSTHNLSM